MNIFGQTSLASEWYFIIGNVFIPIALISWVIAYTVSELGGLYNKIKAFELWFRRIIAVLFFVVGIYYLVKTIF